MIGLRIFGFGNSPRSILVGIKKVLDETHSQLFSPVSVHSDALSIPEDAYDPKRHQYLATPFLQILESHVPQNLHGLGVVNLDLFVPQLNYIFGIAQPGGSALVALPRLRPTFYQDPTNDSLYFGRVTKEVIHELGHVLGLGHCTNVCVMRFSNSLSDTDKKPVFYCDRCTHQLQKYLK